MRKVTSTFRILVFLLPINSVFSQIYFLDYQEYPATSIDVRLDSITGYIFGPEETSRIFKGKRRGNLLNYWYIDKCLLEYVERKLHNWWISERKPDYKLLYNYTRQYFPYIDKEGQQIIVITFSLVDKSDDSIQSRISSGYRYVYDASKTYKLLQYNLTTDEFFLDQ